MKQIGHTHKKEREQNKVWNINPSLTSTWSQKTAEEESYKLMENTQGEDEGLKHRRKMLECVALSLEGQGA